MVYKLYSIREISWVYPIIHAMYLRNSDHILTMKSTFIFLMSFAILLAFVSIGSVYAQNQSQNQSLMVPKNKQWLLFQIALKLY